LNPRRTRILEGVIVAGALAMIALLGARPLFAVDLFWHLKLGDVIGATGAIPETDLFSAVHPDSPWIQFQWLWEWLASEIVAAGGLTGLRLAQAATLTLGFGALYAIVRRGQGPVVAALIVALALLFLGDRFRVRPDGVNILGFVAALPILLGGWRRAGRGLLLGTGLLGALWSNLHGGGSLLLVVMTGAVATGALVDALRDPTDANRRARQASISLFFAATAGVLANPILFDGLVHFVQIFGAATSRIPNPEWEWTWRFLQEGSHAHHFGVALLPTLIAIGWGLERALAWRERAWRAGDVGEALLSAGLLFIAHYWVRTAFLAILPALFLIQRARERAWLSSRTILLLAAFVAACTLHYQIERGRGGLQNTLAMTAHDLEPTVFPERAADFLVDAGIEGGILNEGKWGGYLIWRTWPRCRVFFDTRHNLTEPMWDLLVRSLHPLQRPGAMQAAFEEHGLELAVFKGPVFPLLQPPPEWILLFKAGPEEIYQHRDGAHAAVNVARARRWLEERADVSDAPIADPARRIARAGGGLWLADPWRVKRMAETDKALESDDPGEVVRALFLQARRMHRADHHAEAVSLLERLLGLDGSHARARVHLALSLHAMGASEAVPPVLEALMKQGPSSLRPFEAAQAEALFRHHGIAPSRSY